MMIRKDTDIPASDVTTEGAEGVKIRVIISAEDGAPNFIMRRFTIKPGGHTPYHTHSWEHEVYVLSGTGQARHSTGTVDIGPGTVILVEPDDEHNFTNTGTTDLDFLCIVPKQ
ncbi:MAG TPA: cupin domain-containing protein [Candidatus Sabulitectum sp.]|nr:cupin domain-containing protein [Candidatus Sabulitectum sp.]